MANVKQLSDIIRSVLLSTSPFLFTSKDPADTRLSFVNDDILFSCISQELVIPFIKAFKEWTLKACACAFKEKRESVSTSSELGSSVVLMHSCNNLLTILENAVSILLQNATNSKKIRGNSSNFLCLIDVVRQTAVSQILQLFCPKVDASIESATLISENGSAHTATSSRLQRLTKPDHKTRTIRIARKNALWYLCAVINLTFSHSIRTFESNASSSNSKMTPHGEDLAKAKMEDSLTRLLSLCAHSTSTRSCAMTSGKWEGENTLDDVERGMIMAIGEKFWNWR
jgi:hypothetical protein